MVAISSYLSQSCLLTRLAAVSHLMVIREWKLAAGNQEMEARSRVMNRIRGGAIEGIRLHIHICLMICIS